MWFSVKDTCKIMIKRRQRKFCWRDDVGNYDEEILEEIMIKIRWRKLWWWDDEGNYDEESFIKKIVIKTTIFKQRTL